MLNIWNNPEFVRHRRSELRKKRTLIAFAVTLAVCMLLGLFLWTPLPTTVPVDTHLPLPSPEEAKMLLAQMVRTQTIEFFNRYFVVLFYVQGLVFTLWSLVACAQSIASERDKKTWDFQRVTRLSPGELLIGKLLGEPVLGYFIVACSIPFTVAAGLLGHAPPSEIAGCYSLMFACALFLGVAGIWLSSLTESRSRGVSLIGALVIYGLMLSTYILAQSYFPGAAAFSPLTVADSLMTESSSFVLDMSMRASLFGIAVPWFTMSLLLYATFGAWFVLMAMRNLKRDYEDIRPLSPWQAVGFAVFLEFVSCALAKPPALDPMNDLLGLSVTQAFVSSVLTLNTALLFVVGLVALSPAEHLKIANRSSASETRAVFREGGPPWPWIALSAVPAYAFLALDLWAWSARLPFGAQALRLAAVQSFVVALFVIRDILLLQWCKLTRMRSPVMKGMLLLCLYYAACGVILSVVETNSHRAALVWVNLMSPFDTLSVSFQFSVSVAIGIVLQLLAIGALIWAIDRKFSAPLKPEPAVAD
jgi:hypothetical protein